MQNLDLDLVTALAVAVLAGAAIGLERQWSGHASGERARFGGIRTFTLLGTLAGLGGWMSTGDLRPIAIVLVASACGLIAIGDLSGRAVGDSRSAGTVSANALTAAALAAGVLANTGLKLAVAIVIGRGVFRGVVTAALGTMAAAMAAALLLR